MQKKVPFYKERNMENFIRDGINKYLKTKTKGTEERVGPMLSLMRIFEGLSRGITLGAYSPSRRLRFEVLKPTRIFFDRCEEVGFSGNVIDYLIEKPHLGHGRVCIYRPKNPIKNKTTGEERVLSGRINIDLGDYIEASYDVESCNDRSVSVTPVHMCRIGPDILGSKLAIVDSMPPIGNEKLVRLDRLTNKLNGLY